jgi:multiple sugar transport system substrate-binding protein
VVWYWGEQDFPGIKAYMEKAVKMYMDTYPDVDVEAVLQESDNLYAAFRTAEAAGESPDVQFLWAGALCLEDAWLGNLAPIDEYLSPELLASFSPDALAETNWDGKQWGMPWLGSFYACVYNKKLFAEAGLDPETPPETWDDFINACTKLKAAGITPVGAGLKDGYLQGWFSYYFGQQNLDTPADLIAVCKGVANYTEPMYSSWLKIIEELKNKKYFNDDILSLDLYQGQQLFESGDVAITLLTQPYVATLERRMGSDTVRFFRTPTFGTGDLNDCLANPSQVLCIPKSAKNKEGAAQFLEFLNAPEQLKLKYEMSNVFTPSNCFDPSWVASDITTDRYAYDWLQTEVSFTYQNVYPPVFEYEGLVPVIQRMFSENLSAEAAGQALEDSLAKWRRENPEQLDAYNRWNYKW